MFSKPSYKESELNCEDHGTRPKMNPKKSEENSRIQRPITNSFALSNTKKINAPRQMDELSDQLMKLAVEGCESAERIGAENQRRYCLKNVSKLSSKTLQQLKRSDSSKAKSEDPNWIMKNQILASARILDGWKELGDLLQHRHEEYKDVEEKFYHPGIRDTFYEWQSATSDLVHDLLESLKAVNEPGLRGASIPKKDRLELASPFIASNLIPSSVNGGVNRRRVDLNECRFRVPDESHDRVEASCEDDGLMIHSQFCDLTLGCSAQHFFDPMHEQKLSPDSEWRAALLSAPKLVEENLSPINGFYDESKNNDEKCNKNDIKIIGIPLINYLEEELCIKISARRAADIVEYKPIWKNSTTLADIHNKLKNNQYCTKNEFLKDIERAFYSMLNYFEFCPDKHLEKIIEDVRENFWITARVRLCMTD